MFGIGETVHKKMAAVAIGIVAFAISVTAQKVINNRIFRT